MKFSIVKYPALSEIYTLGRDARQGDEKKKRRRRVWRAGFNLGRPIVYNFYVKKVSPHSC